MFFADFYLLFYPSAVQRVVFIALDFLAAVSPDFGQYEAVFEVVVQGEAAAVCPTHEGEARVC